jgi:hypothetical protein
MAAAIGSNVSLSIFVKSTEVSNRLFTELSAHRIEKYK